MIGQEETKKQAPQFNTVGIPCTVPGCTTGNPALRTVGKESFCQAHTPEAFEAAASTSAACDKRSKLQGEEYYTLGEVDFEPEIEELETTFDFKVDVEREEE
jgi:hypothetical protein